MYQPLLLSYRINRFRIFLWVSHISIMQSIINSPVGAHTVFFIKEHQYITHSLNQLITGIIFYCLLQSLCKSMDSKRSSCFYQLFHFLRIRFFSYHGSQKPFIVRVFTDIIDDFFNINFSDSWQCSHIRLWPTEFFSCQSTDRSPLSSIHNPFCKYGKFIKFSLQDYIIHMISINFMDIFSCPGLFAGGLESCIIIGIPGHIQEQVTDTNFRTCLIGRIAGSGFVFFYNAV